MDDASKIGMMFVCFIWLFIISISPRTSGFSQPNNKAKTKVNWIAELQKCRTTTETFERVCSRLLSEPPDECNPTLYSLILIRLSRQILSSGLRTLNAKDSNAIGRIVIGLVRTRERFDFNEASTIECVEGTKATAIIARLVCVDATVYFPLCEFWQEFFSTGNGRTERHDLLPPSSMTGLRWAMDTFASMDKDNTEHVRKCEIPARFRRAYDELKIPFRIIPNCLSWNNTDSLESIPFLVREVKFGADTIQASSTGHIIRERRWTAWQGDLGVAPFTYSGKSMATQDWTPSVRLVRNQLLYQTHQYYDGCLLNYYPDGESAMRYHRDPDQGTIWDYDTAVVSFGSPRPFSFRDCNKEIHNFVVFHGDVTHMFADCQERFEHTVKKADVSESPRISLVFKRSFR